ncbi:MAG: undecaprenyl-diphosphatase [Novosphingobium sp. 28-62-57]|uniref:undecaprenyl-diphosphate phosphatase n=1 Tax=unclassified Novosphingobium TaxID=2644732 RepID=UPI000BDCE764|nr:MULTISPECIES: undecaprenyl-diphosphate phosphatase [unclassified Novosphingobium]OYW48399.1 MAG: undecaprenyl-diphosphatase [Novosphingobium sp. 12-62-10]OYZ09262.1 MAG: undecaprenyl-diphosphatase [Novosphingobium sp. 28-62-57]OZA36099.1 MAG: undecaprenyl-diphosphatase [Novosphingobium sp. 17-62-9]HQS71397.1 undecaprenyl-diphosphate phosphatase [Novosphingobium sp.]
MDSIVTAILLGIVEGLTEFLPVSSTGHLILATELFGFDPHQWAMFNVVIQLGAILAVVVQYWRTFWAVGMGLMRLEPISLRFLRNLLAAFIPSAILGLALKDYIDVLLGSPSVVGWALVIGGIAILVIEKYAKPGELTGIGQLPLSQALGVGFVQCLAMVPGVSRSGATIMGALAMGIERRTAAEFSFFLAIPTMLGATALELLDNREAIMSGTLGAGGVGWAEIAVGFVVSFIVALAVIRFFVAYVSRAGFKPFAWYRIVAGTVAIIWLAMR